MSEALPCGNIAHVKRMIGKRLEAEIAKRGLDQKEFAALAGVSEAAVSRHIRDERAPQLEMVAKYARALGVSASWLLDAEENEQYAFTAVPEILTDRYRRKLTPNAKEAVENFNWDAVRAEDEQSIIQLIGSIDVDNLCLTVIAGWQ